MERGDIYIVPLEKVELELLWILSELENSSFYL